MSDFAPAQAQAFWVIGPLQSEWRHLDLPPLAPDEVRVRTLHTGVSRGTETLVYRAQVPVSEAQRMRAPFQSGAFPHPVQYGYVNVGQVEQGPAALVGQTVFCLFPHQTLYQVPASAVVPLPPGVPPARAVLAANLETAINALWDADLRMGQRVAVVGAGTLGLLVAWLAARIPGCAVEVIDIEPSRAAVAQVLGARFSLPQQASGNADLVVHTSASEAGLGTALRLAAFEATVLELSWYGNRPVQVPLGEDFHARRLQLKSSQVGSVAPAMRQRFTHRQRLELALSLLTDARLDALITHSAPWDQLPQVMARLAGPGAADVLCHRIDYPAAP
ncbi:MAG: zinc-binding alcohol dehydrogenase [Hydrogenophaga sp.]|jgi:threonine dehydrogenase-like Zn-dependent dehydrogenase|nr:zinc-binding alcohol dehydrogenase [Hydrogenophaga sp.]